MKNYIKILLREGLLTEITSDEAWNKFYSDANKFPLLNGDIDLFNQIEDLYPKANNQHNRGYFIWIYNQIKRGLKNEDFYKVKEYLRLFNKFINVIDKDKRDINKYKTVQDLYLAVKDFEENEDEIATSKTSELKKIREEEIDLVYSDSEWSVYVPLTERASCLIGKGTQWCTAADKSNNMFDHYNRDGKLYVLINKDDDSKYQLHFESNQLMDANDREVSASYFFDNIGSGELYDFLKGESDNFYEFILKTSVEDIAGGGYSETFDEALNSANKDSETYREILNDLRYGSDSGAKYLGFTYEKDPDRIDTWQVKELFDDGYMEEEDFNRIIEHLINIGYDFEESGVGDAIEHIKALKELKLTVNQNYNIDKGRTLRINKVNFDDNTDKPYNITIRDSDGGSKTGNIGFEALKNLRYNMSLFEQKNNKKYISKVLREEIIDEDYPQSWDIEEFKKLKSFNARIKYCNQHLTRISSGSSRVVYKIDDEKVLKLAKNKKGLAQNEVEIEYGGYNDLSDIVAKVFESDENNLWVEMELARRVKASDFKRIVGYDFELIEQAIQNYGVDSGNTKARVKYKIDPEIWDDMWENEFMYAIFGYIGNYGVPVGDLRRLSSYGLVNRNGEDKIVLIDYGLTHDVYDSYYS
jgi:hypothetical protein